MTIHVPFILRRLNPAQPRPGDQQRRHRAMFALDIADFSSRPAHLQIPLRKALYNIVPNACDSTGLPWRHCLHEDRGDGMFVLARADIDFEILLNPLTEHISNALRTHNRTADNTAQIRLRMAVHAGYIQHDDHGITGPDLNHLFRLLNAPPLKASLTTHHNDLALIVSDYLYNIAANYNLINPAHYQPTTINHKETNTQAWIRTPT